MTRLEKARQHLAIAKKLMKAARLAPAEDARALRPARIMASIYRALLRKMQKDGLRVMEKRYRLSKPEKLWAIIRAVAATGGRASPRAA